MRGRHVMPDTIPPLDIVVGRLHAAHGDLAAAAVVAIGLLRDQADQWPAERPEVVSFDVKLRPGAGYDQTWVALTIMLGSSMVNIIDWGEVTPSIRGLLDVRWIVVSS